MNKTLNKKSKIFYRRLLVAHLIDNGINTVPLLLAETSMCKRTLQSTLSALSEIDIECEVGGGTKNRTYSIKSWGVINKKEVKTIFPRIKKVLGLS